MTAAAHSPDMPVEASRTPGAARALVAAAGYPLLLVCYLFVWPFTQGTGAGSFLEIGTCLALSLGLLCLAPPQSVNALTKRTLLLVCPAIVYFFVAITAASVADDTKNLLWLLFGVALLVASLRTNLGQLPVYAAYRAIAYAALLVFVSQNIEAILSYGGGRGRVSFDNQAYTLSAYALLSATVCALYGLVSTSRGTLLNLAVLTVSLAAIVSTGTRSVYLGLLLALVAILYRASRFPRGGRQLVRLAIFLVSALVLLMLVPTIGDRLLALTETAWRGALAISGDADGHEASALGRYLLREAGLGNFAAEPLLGTGYKTLWLDFPALQVFQDFGVFFGLAFWLAMIIIPAGVSVSVLRRGNESESVIALIYLANLPRLFFHGQPYDWVIFCYALPVYGIMAGASWRARPSGGT